MLRRSLVALCLAVLVVVAVPAAQAAYVGEDIGTTLAGSSDDTTVPGQITIVGNGSDIWDSSDNFHYYHDSWTGDFNAVVRLVSQQNTDGWAKAGIMARETTAANSQHTHISATPGNAVTIQWRDDNGGGSGTAGIVGSPNSGSAPYWLALSRRGDLFTARWAPDVAGSPGFWQTGLAHTNAMPATVELGLNVTSHNGGTTSECVFDNLATGNWETVGALGTSGMSIIGKAYAQDRNTAAELGPVRWKIEQVITTTGSYDGPGIKNEWYDNETHTPPTVVGPFVTNSINRGDSSYPTEVGWSGNHDYFSVRYTGQFYADHDGTFAFQEHVDDEAWLFIDGSEVLHNNEWNTATSTTVDLTEGWHDLEFRTRDGNGGDFAYLSWDPAGGDDWAIMDTTNAFFRTAYSYSYTTLSLLAEGTYNVGDPLCNTGVFIPYLAAGKYTLRLTVDYLGETTVTEQTVVVPEPATCLLLGGGLLALVRRRRRA